MSKTERGAYGQGRVRWYLGRYKIYIPDGKGGETNTGSVASSCQGCEDCEAYREAHRRRKAALIARGVLVVGVTFRQLGEGYLEDHKLEHRSIKTECATFNNILCQAPFIDEAVDDTPTPTLTRWIRRVLPTIDKKQSVWNYETRKRETKTLTGQKIAFHYQTNAVGLLKQMCKWGKADGIITINPAADAPSAPPRRAEIDEPLSVMSRHETELAMSCRTCGDLYGADPSDAAILIPCPHLPFEKRVAFTLEIHQCPREGELCAMRWNRVDWDAEGWTLCESWNRTPPKNGKSRWQALLPRARRILFAWWELQGRPEEGFVFPSKRSKTGKGHYARGYDFGWAGTQTRDKYYPGWRERLGIQTLVVFHEMRDTCATHLLSSTWDRKWDLKEVSEHIGHRSVKITEERYAHFTREAKQLAARATESDPKRMKKSRGQPGLNPASDFLADAAKEAIFRAPEAGLEPTTNRLTAASLNKGSGQLAGNRPASGRVLGRAGKDNPASPAAPDDAVDAAWSLLDALAKGERSAVHARAMAQAVYADAAPAQVLAARLLWRHAQPCDDGIRLAGLLAQLGSSHAKRLLAEMSTGGWDAEAAAAMVDDVLDSAPRTLGLAARVLARPDQWGHALTLADELTQQQRDGHARGDARGKIPTYAGTARRTTRQNR